MKNYARSNRIFDGGKKMEMAEAPTDVNKKPGDCITSFLQEFSTDFCAKAWLSEVNQFFKH